MEYLKFIFAFLLLLSCNRSAKTESVTDTSSESDSLELINLMQEFVHDSSLQNNEKTIWSALSLTEKYPESKEATICREWFQLHHIDYIESKTQRKEFFNKLHQSSVSQAKINYELNGTQPSNDEQHSEAFIIAKQFVEQKLKAPTSADFSSDYYWGYLENETYIIRSTVDAQNSLGAQLRNHWSAKLRYKGGEWTELSNWELIEINVTE